MSNGKMVYINLRPGVRTFIQRLAEYFELIIWSSYQNEYTTKLLEIIDPEQKYFSHVLNKSHCQKSVDGTIFLKRVDVLL
mmetsp:Transcript_5347/g.4056  ORF Transcript_5347/g.4056 Transcript_5347/m.4056 type:complete len:80 (+) Transcript_5347:436-675(+)